VFYLPITKALIISPLARRIYLVCAVLAISLFGTFVATRLALAFSGIRSLGEAPSAELLVKGLIFPGVCGTAVLTVAMWYFWLSFDQSSWVKKAFWFLPLYLLLSIGPALFFFFVYRPQTAAPKERNNTAQGASPG